MIDKGQRAKYKRKNRDTNGVRDFRITFAMLSALLILTLFQSYQLFALSSEINAKKGNTVASVTGGSDILQNIIEEVTPKGTPDYGEKAGVSYDNVEEALGTLSSYAGLSLSAEEQQRYETIANTEGTACSYCCGATKLAQNCGCSHNIALQGLTKWLIKNTNYSNEQIIQEIKKWQILFFPQPTLQEELQKRNINPESVGLPTMRGGC